MTAMRVVALASMLCFAALPLFGRDREAERAIETIQAAMESGDLSGASRLLTSALTRYPRDAGLYNLRGVIHAQQSEVTDARTDFQRAVQLSPELTPAWQNLARVCMSVQDAAAMSCASDAWRRVLRAYPTDTEARSSLATVDEWQGKFADSLQELDRLPPDQSSGASMLALRCGDLAGLGRARESAQTARLLVQTPDYSETVAGTILPVLEAMHRADVTITLIEALDAHGQASPGSLRHLALAYEALDRLPDARRVLERVAVADPGNSRHLLELARIAYRAHDLEGSLGYLAHVRDLTPGDGRVHFLFGLVAIEMELPVEARRSLEKSLAIDPENPEFNYAMGGLLLSAGNGAESVPFFAKYVAARPGDPKGHFALGAAYFAAMEYDRCRAEMLRIGKDPKTESGAAYFLGRVARMEDNFAEAATQLEHAIQVTPSFPEAYTELARVRIAQSRLADARTAVDHALLLDPDNFLSNSALLTVMQLTHDPATERQTAHLRTLDAERSRRRALLMRTIEVKPY